ncbi:MAG: TetR/AcrR family transcriptional regulator [Methanoregula sp.]|nr:TetR/AcrR family transcriptional regulator [Methanoregula sp.]
MPKLYPGYRDEIRKKIVAEAFSVFLQKGFEKTKMEDIAARLNVTKPAIYRYFRNKEDLFFTALVEQLMQEYYEAFSRSFVTGDLLCDGGVFFDAILALHQKYATISLEIIKVMTRNESLRARVREYRTEGLRITSQYFSLQVRTGRISPALDAQEIAWAFHALIKGAVENVMMGMDAADAKRIWLSVLTELLKIQKSPAS